MTPQLERLHRAAAYRQLVGKCLETRGPACARRVATEFGSESWINEQPFDQLLGAIELPLSG